MRRWVGWVAVIAIMAAAAMALAGDDEPMFIRWLRPEDPGDVAIRAYWERAEAGEASVAELLDLGTMLFHRGYPKDAVRTFQRALKLDDRSYEAWFRIGLVQHREGRLQSAKRAYRKCLHLLTGHGWCNFYMGLLQERLDNPRKAMDYYRRAFKFAPELADPAVNPEVLYSRLAVAPLMRTTEAGRFASLMPMALQEPDRVRRASGLPEPAPEPTPAPRVAPTLAPRPVTGVPSSAVAVPSVSEEARFGGAATTRTDDQSGSGAGSTPARRPRPTPKVVVVEPTPVPTTAQAGGATAESKPRSPRMDRNLSGGMPPLPDLPPPVQPTPTPAP